MAVEGEFADALARQILWADDAARLVDIDRAMPERTDGEDRDGQERRCPPFEQAGPIIVPEGDVELAVWHGHFLQRHINPFACPAFPFGTWQPRPKSVVARWCPGPKAKGRLAAAFS